MKPSKVYRNGLTTQQTDARPEPFYGMLLYIATMSHHAPIWVLMKRDPLEEVNKQFIREDCLLPGEEGCPWPPTSMNYRHVWKENEAAWVLHKPGGDPKLDVYNNQWVKCRAAFDSYQGGVTSLGFLGTNGVYYGPCDETPALYIPGTMFDNF